MGRIYTETRKVTPSSSVNGEPYTSNLVVNLPVDLTGVSGASDERTLITLAKGLMTQLTCWNGYADEPSTLIQAATSQVTASKYNYTDSTPNKSARPTRLLGKFTVRKVPESTIYAATDVADVTQFSYEEYSTDGFLTTEEILVVWNNIRSKLGTIYGVTGGNNFYYNCVGNFEFLDINLTYGYIPE